MGRVRVEVSTPIRPSPMLFLPAAPYRACVRSSHVPEGDDFLKLLHQWIASGRSEPFTRQEGNGDKNNQQDSVRRCRTQIELPQLRENLDRDWPVGVHVHDDGRNKFAKRGDKRKQAA